MKVVILAYMASIVIKASTVSLVGAIGGVAAAVITFCIWTTPWFKRLTGRDIRRALRTESSYLKVGPVINSEVEVDIGLVLRNESDFALTRTIRTFDVSSEVGRLHSLQGEPPRDDVFDRQTKTWEAQRFKVTTREFPATFKIDYVIDYGRLDKRPTKRLEGQRDIATGPTTHPQPNQTMTEKRPDRHSRIKRKDRIK